MPNWCATRYACIGDENELQDLYDRMKRLQEMKEPLKPNGFGTAWLGNLVEDLGVDFNTVQCRGSWDDPTLENTVLRFSTETAWYRCTEVEDLIREKFPSIEIFFICEEPGMCIYEKNSNVYFDEDYAFTATAPHIQVVGLDGFSTLYYYLQDGWYNNGTEDGAFKPGWCNDSGEIVDLVIAPQTGFWVKAPAAGMTIKYKK